MLPSIGHPLERPVGVVVESSLIAELVGDRVNLTTAVDRDLDRASLTVRDRCQVANGIVGVVDRPTARIGHRFQPPGGEVGEGCGVRARLLLCKYSTSCRSVG